MTPKVSVIIPFDNVENYIEECLDSVVNQTLSDIEIILINDASTDSTIEKARKYAENDSRIKIIGLPEKSGQGKARNAGIEAASGKYIAFVDSDDFADKTSFEKMYNAAKDGDCDLVMCRVCQYDDLNGKYITSPYYNMEVLEDFEGRIFSARETASEILNINVALWNKLYNREFLLKTGQKFPEGFIYEDLPFFFGTYTLANRIKIVPEVLYNYRINRKNSTMTLRNSKISDRCYMVSLTYEILKSVPYLLSEKKKIQGFIIDDLFFGYVRAENNRKREFFFEMKKVFQNLEIENPDDDFWKTVYCFDGYKAVINSTFEEFNEISFAKYWDLKEAAADIKRELGVSLYRTCEETNQKVNDIRYDLNKCYDYINEVKRQCALNASDDKSRTGDIIREVSDTERKFSRVYSEIETVCRHFEELISKVEKRISLAEKEIEHLKSQTEKANGEAGK